MDYGRSSYLYEIAILIFSEIRKRSDIDRGAFFVAFFSVKLAHGKETCLPAGRFPKGLPVGKANNLNQSRYAN